MGVTWTDRQREAIDVRNSNVLVSAAAGSGKTAVLVERIKKLIIDEGVSVDEMLVATFTNAAAGDMKEKIVKAIQKAIRDGDGDGRFLKNELDKVYKANISTFHSFALEVIRRYFYVINADPDFKICDDAEKTIMRLEAADELFAEKFDSNDEKFINFLKAYCDAKSERKAKEMVLALHETIQALPGPFLWLSDKTAMINSSQEELFGYLAGFILEDVKENLNYASDAFQKVCEILSKAGAFALEAKGMKDIAQIRDILKTAEEGDYDKVANSINNISFERFAAGKDEKETYEDVKEQISKIRGGGKDCIKEIRDKYFANPFFDEAGLINATYEYSAALLELVIDFETLYKEKKKEKALLDFADIEHLALEILKNPDVAGEYREKFRYIFIDEYQDSNLIQEAMVDSIRRENNVFMVGDVKQSIYKFRLAEPEIFMRKYEAFSKAAGGADVKIDLNTNFRCKGNIIDTVNSICSKIMPYDENSALYKGVGYTGELDYPACLHIVETKDFLGDDIDVEINELKKAEVEAGIIVNIIKDTVGKKIYEEGKDGAGRVRSIGFSDVVILMRAVRSHGDKYYNILTDAGIPAYIDDNEGYFDTVEIEIFMNLLKVIDNKRRDIPLISALYSKVFDFSAAELATVRIEGGKTSYYEAFFRYGTCGADADLRAKCRMAYEKLEEWRELALTLPLDEFIWKLMWDTGYYIYAGALPGGSQRQGNLRALADKALRYMKASREGLYGFIRYAEILKEKSGQIGQVSLIGENDDVVRILTVHKSKGLEFPVVIVAGLGRRFAGGRERSDVSMHKNIGAALPFYDASARKHRKTLLQSVIESRNKKEGMDEEARILYVALTRAKDMLILVGTVSDAEKALENYKFTDTGNRRMTSCYMDMIAPVFLEKNLEYKVHNRGDVYTQAKKGDIFKDELRRRLSGAGVSFPGAGKEFIEERLSFEYSGQKALSAKSKYSVSEITRGQFQAGREGAPAVPVFIHGKEKPANVDIGTAVHVVMEKMDFAEASRLFDLSESKGRGYLSGLITGLSEKIMLTPETAKLVDINAIAAFIKSDIGRRAAKATQLYKETPFNLIKEIDGTDTIIQGVIDCYFEENGEYVLIDYKTDRASGRADMERIKETYAGQLALYGEALETIKKVKVKEKYIYLFGMGAEIFVE